ncbi:MAG: VCBS repeat-containing protein [Acidobacteriia bacterium]|nr:VCBS repeat-containing protein [Terriglobia bacterium]
MYNAFRAFFFVVSMTLLTNIAWAQSCLSSCTKQAAACFGSSEINRELCLGEGNFDDVCDLQSAIQDTICSGNLADCVNGCQPPPVLATHFNTAEAWTTNPYFGSHGTFFADVDGDGKADAIVVNDDNVVVRRSNGTSFGPNEFWTTNPFFGSRGTFFADVDGDGKADAIVVNDGTDGTVVVRRSTGSSFGPNEFWTTNPYFGSRGTFFADVDGDGKADAIVVNDGTDGTVVVRRSTGTRFSLNESFTTDPFFGSIGTFFADVDGDGMADAIAVNSDNIVVRRSNGMSFGPNEFWTTDPYFGSVGTFFADVDHDGRADAIAVNSSGVLVRRAIH